VFEADINNSHPDDDILQCKADILRAKDLVPPFGPEKQKPPQTPKKQDSKDNVDLPAPQTAVPCSEIEQGLDSPKLTDKLRAQGALSDQEVSALLGETVAGEEAPAASQDHDSKPKVDIAAQKLNITVEDTAVMSPPKQQEAVINAAKPDKDQQQDRYKIPEFNLAEQIMAEQRKTSAVKRKGPGQKNVAVKKEPQQRRSVHIDSTPPPLSSLCRQIIADIVAKDIERLCNTSTFEILPKGG